MKGSSQLIANEENYYDRTGVYTVEPVCCESLW